MEITCVLNPNHDLLQKVFSDNAADDNLLSHRIRFYRNDERVPEQYVSIINSTAAQLRVPNPPASFDVYKCMACLDKNNHFVQRSKSPDTSINSALKKYLVNTVESHPSSDSHDIHNDCIGVCLNNVFVGCKLTAILSYNIYIYILSYFPILYIKYYFFFFLLEISFKHFQQCSSWKRLSCDYIILESL